jgi:hypothetical protein
MVTNGGSDKAPKKCEGDAMPFPAVFQIDAKVYLCVLTGPVVKLVWSAI